MGEGEKVGQEQIHDLLFGEKLSWQGIIYDLVNSEQLDPWDIDISILVDKYLARVKELEEANFFVSSKVLLAASLLLRMKSDILLNEHIPSLDEVLFGKKEEGKKYVQERIELEDDIPHLIPRTPLPRFRKVTLQELMSALGHAIKTETRRIKKEIIFRQQEKETEIALPKNGINLKDSIQIIYDKIVAVFKKQDERIAFSNLVDTTREERIRGFVSLLHLDNQQKVWLEQDGHLDEIWILLKHIYEMKNKELLEVKRKEVDEYMNSEAAKLPPEELHEPEEEEERVISKEDLEEVTGFDKND